MQTFSLEDIILYANCPLKFVLNKKYNKLVTAEVDDRTIITSALKDTFIKHFQMYGMKMRWSTAQSVRYFSKQWKSYIQSLMLLNKPHSNTTNIIIKAHETIINYDNILEKHDQIVAVNFPIERRVSKYLVTDTVDLILFNETPGQVPIVKVIYINESIDGNSIDNFRSLIRFYFANSCIHRDLISYDIDTEFKKYNLKDNKFKKISLFRNNKINYIRFINNLCKAVDANLIYPRASLDACEHCSYNTVCSWKYN